jgi:hypothetical protein
MRTKQEKTPRLKYETRFPLGVGFPLQTGIVLKRISLFPDQYKVIGLMIDFETKKFYGKLR